MPSDWSAPRIPLTCFEPRLCQFDTLTYVRPDALSPSKFDLENAA